MFVLGIDPGLSRCGYGLVGRGEADSALSARAAGVIETDPAAPLPHTAAAPLRSPDHLFT